MNPFLRMCFYLAIFLFTMADAYQTNAQKPNVLFIAIDDLNSCLKGMEGETQVETPHINSLAEQGVLFTNAHCAAPACNPSRAAVMTGFAPSTSGVYFNNQDWRINEMLRDVVTLPQHFKNNGYATRGGGKLYHAATLSDSGYTGWLDSRPWDEYFPSKQRQMPQEVMSSNFPENGNKRFYRGFFDWAALDIEPDEMADAKVVAWAERHLMQTSSKPLFLAVGIYRPHIPWYTPKQYFEKHPIDALKMPQVTKDDLSDVPSAGQRMAKREWHRWMVDNDKWQEAVQAYYASVSFADDMVGRLLTALRSGPLADNTVVVLWADHGYHLGQKEHWEKFALWEQTTRVPLIVATPQGFELPIQRGAKCAQPVSLLDIYPTLCEMCEVPSDEERDGVSLLPLLANPNMENERMVICTQGVGNHAVRSDRWRYIRYANDSEELYDQRSDPKNFHNLATKTQYRAVIEKMANALPKHDTVPDPLPNRRRK